MVPSSVVAVLIFLVLVTPGVAFELLWRRTRPRRDESAFVEVSRVLLAGTGFSAAAITTIIVLEAIAPGSLIDATDMLRTGQQYVSGQPVATLVTAAAIPILAVLYCVVVHDLLTPGRLRRLEQETLWHSAFSRLGDSGVHVYLSVQLKDGTTVTGYLHGYPTEPDPGKRELLLAARPGEPLTIRPPSAPRAVKLDPAWQRILLLGSEIATIATCYVGSRNPTPIPTRLQRLWVKAARRIWLLALGGAVLVSVLLLALAPVIR